MFTHRHTRYDTSVVTKQCTVSFSSTVEYVKHGYLLTHTVFARIRYDLSVFMKVRTLFICFSVFVVNFFYGFVSHLLNNFEFKHRHAAKYLNKYLFSPVLFCKWYIQWEVYFCGQWIERRWQNKAIAILILRK